MAYNPFTWQDDTTPITAARLNALENGLAATSVQLDSTTGVANANSSALSTQVAAVTTLQQFAAKLLFAPTPSGDTTGATDQAALQPLLTAAYAGKGTLYLCPGKYYVTGLTGTAGFNQARIQGPGRDYCSIIGTGGATTPAIRLNGGSGRSSGGGISDVTIENPGGDALMLADVTSTTHYRLVFQNCSVGVRFHIAQAAGFCEFNVVYDSDFRYCATAAARYSTAYGESFHGSGIDGNTTINVASQSMIVIDNGCLPYQAPMNFTGFPRSNTPVIYYNGTGGSRAPQFYGTIRLEGSSGHTVAGPNQVNFDGNVQLFGSTGGNLGSLVQIDGASYYNNAGVWIRRKPYFSYSGDTYGIGNSPSQLGSLQYGIGHLVDVDLRCANYFRRYLLYVTQNPYSTGGNVSVLAEQNIDNTAGYGGVTAWSISGYVLSAAISGAPANASSPVRAYVRFNPVGERNIY